MVQLFRQQLCLIGQKIKILTFLKVVSFKKHATYVKCVSKENHHHYREKNSMSKHRFFSKKNRDKNIEDVYFESLNVCNDSFIKNSHFKKLSWMRSGLYSLNILNIMGYVL